MTAQDDGADRKPETMSLDLRLAALADSPIPTWVLDPQPIRILWANPQAITLWNAPNRQELLSRTFEPVPDSVRTRIHASLDKLRKGQSHAEEWTLFPGGIPQVVMMHFSALYLEDGRLAFLQQAIPKAEVHPQTLRAVEALHHTSGMVAFVRQDGLLLHQNPAALQTFGMSTQRWTDWLRHPEEGITLLESVARDESVVAEREVSTQNGYRWHKIEMHQVRDAVTGDLVTLVHQTDVTDRQTAEAEIVTQTKLLHELEQALSLLDEQRRDILSLSAPILEVASDTLALPLIGTLDQGRFGEITSRLLHQISHTRAARVIVDLTGAAAMAPSSAQHLGRMASAVRLLGAQVVLTGVSAKLAQTLMQADHDLGSVPTFRTLAEGIRSHSTRPLRTQS
jgi:anti-anti-sigma regulatory factor/PAS domain-containing protein